MRRNRCRAANRKPHHPTFPRSSVNRARRRKFYAAIFGARQRKPLPANTPESSTPKTLPDPLPTATIPKSVRGICRVLQYRRVIAPNDSRQNRSPASQCHTASPNPKEIQTPHTPGKVRKKRNRQQRPVTNPRQRIYRRKNFRAFPNADPLGKSDEKQQRARATNPSLCPQQRNV